MPESHGTLRLTKRCRHRARHGNSGYRTPLRWRDERDPWSCSAC